MKRCLAMVLLVSMLLLCGCANKNAYEAAEALMAAGDNAAAREAFAGLADYKDAPERAKECAYRIALGLLDAGDYAGALAGFLELGEYQNSAQLAGQCQTELDNAQTYAGALAGFEAGEYEMALETFVGLGEYRDSVLYAGKCINQLGFYTEYLGKRYHCVPQGWGRDGEGRLTLALLINEPVYVRVGELAGQELSMKAPPFAASVMVSKKEYAALDYTLNDTLCTFVFDTAGEPESLTLRSFMLTGGEPQFRQNIDPATVPWR